MNIFETCAENYVAIGSSAVLCSPFPVGSSTLTAGPTHYTSLLIITQIGCQILIFLYIIIFLSFPKKDVEEYKAMTGRCGDQSKQLVMSFQFILYTAACCLLPSPPGRPAHSLLVPVSLLSRDIISQDSNLTLSIKHWTYVSAPACRWYKYIDGDPISNNNIAASVIIHYQTRTIILIPWEFYENTGFVLLCFLTTSSVIWNTK